jgi:hypothetical protein
MLAVASVPPSCGPLSSPEDVPPLLLLGPLLLPLLLVPLLVPSMKCTSSPDPSTAAVPTA